MTALVIRKPTPLCDIRLDNRPMAALLKLVPRNAPSQTPESAPSTAPKTHLDIAIENNYICDIYNILISPDSGRFHLSLKTDIEGSSSSLWINVFGEKDHVAAKAIQAIEEVLANGIPQNPDQLKKWREELNIYVTSRATLLMLPE
jgi:hypothetical protein